MCKVYWLHHKDHTNIHEGYIGVSINVDRRLKEHFSNKENPHLHYAFQKYNNIECTILLEGSEDYCYEIEKKLRPNKKMGWNIAEGGAKPPIQIGNQWNKGRRHSKEFKMKMSIIHKGKILSEEHKEKIGRSHIGIFPNEEIRKKLSIAKKGKNHPFYGNKRPEHSAKMSAIWAARRASQ